MIGRGVLFVVMAMFLVSAQISWRMSRSTSMQSSNSVKYYQRAMGRDIAQGGANISLRKLAYNPTWRAGFSDLSLMGGKSSVALADVVFMGQTAIRITSTGRVPFVSPVDDVKFQDTSFTSVAYVPKDYLPKYLRAAITANFDVQTLGTLDVDGREHDTLGTLIPDAGTLGIWTTQDYSKVTGNSTVGGTPPATGIDVAPVGYKKDTVVIRDNQPPPDPWYPGSPDSVMGGPASGYPVGTLMSLSQSGVGGSQYVTDPTSLSYPLKGVTYVELPSGKTWGSANIDGSGILVVHNTTKDAILKDVSGIFRGFIITDDIDKIHGTIIGAVFILKRLPAVGNCIGNGNGSVLYSSQAIAEALKTAKPIRVATYIDRILSWWE